VDALRINDPYSAGCRIELSRTPQPLKRSPHPRC
jgi:hypothetical protein